MNKILLYSWLVVASSFINLTFIDESEAHAKTKCTTEWWRSGYGYEDVVVCVNKMHGHYVCETRNGHINTAKCRWIYHRWGVARY